MLKNMLREDVTPNLFKQGDIKLIILSLSTEHWKIKLGEKKGVSCKRGEKTQPSGWSEG